MVGQTMLKPHVPYVLLFYLCVIDLMLFALKLLLVGQTGIKTSS